MRKFLVLLLVSCAILTDAQVLTLQHSYEGTGFFYNSINRQTKESLMYEDNVDELYGNAYYSELLSYEDSTFTITTYNEDYSFQSMKQFHIPGGHLIAMISVQLSKCTFDDDSNTYEMLVLYIDQSAPTYNNKYLLRLYREDGTLLCMTSEGRTVLHSRPPCICITASIAFGYPKTCSATNLFPTMVGRPSNTRRMMCTK